MNAFMQMVKDRAKAVGGNVCVGLDPDVTKMPAVFQERANPIEVLIDFLSEIVDATADKATAFKPNFAFFAKRGEGGERALVRLIDVIHLKHPGIPVILDAKRGDIGPTNAGYVFEAFTRFNADAVTLNPYLGREANQPFLELKDKGLLFLCRTSNPGSDEFQAVNVDTPHGYMPFYQYVAERIAHHWNEHGNCGLVAGATYPEEAGSIRKIVGDMHLLLPGFGRQGAKPEDIIPRVQGGLYLANSSSAISEAHANPAYAGLGFAEAAAVEVTRFWEQLRAAKLLPPPKPMPDF